MELLMKNIHMCRRAKQVEKQVVLEEDLNAVSYTHLRAHET